MQICYTGIVNKFSPCNLSSLLFKMSHRLLCKDLQTHTKVKSSYEFSLLLRAVDTFLPCICVLEVFGLNGVISLSDFMMIPKHGMLCGY